MFPSAGVVLALLSAAPWVQGPAVPTADPEAAAVITQVLGSAQHPGLRWSAIGDVTEDLAAGKSTTGTVDAHGVQAYYAGQLARARTVQPRPASSSANVSRTRSGTTTVCTSVAGLSFGLQHDVGHDGLVVRRRCAAEFGAEHLECATEVDVVEAGRRVDHAAVGPRVSEAERASDFPCVVHVHAHTP